MVAAAKPADEGARVESLRRLGILDTDAEARFDRITRMAQRIFGTSMASVSLIDEDRQWLKSVEGPLQKEGPRETAFCAHAILERNVTMVVEDATADERFHDNPLVTGDPNIRFYAGHPISSPDGRPLGTLCVIDDRPRDAGDFDHEALQDLAAMVESEIATLQLAIGDDLTGLSNRRGFDLLGSKLLDAAGRMSLPVAAIYIDLDNMKPINDLHGHEAGDRALAETGALLQANMRYSDVLARLGGDEFCALLTGAATGEVASAGERLEEALEIRNASTAEPFALSMSVGTAVAPAGSGRSLAELVGEADEAMLAEKRRRKGANAR